MKKISISMMMEMVVMVVVLTLTLTLAGTPMAQDDQGVDDLDWKTSVDGCYRYTILDNDIMVVQTEVQLTVDKETIARNGKEIQKEANELGKSIHGRLMKHPFISSIGMSPRQITIRTYPFPEHPWEFGEAQVVGDLDQVLCGATTK
jgi:hypothetical protein